MTTTDPTPTTCTRCDCTPAVGLCCSSHKRALCHLCYRRTHWVEVCVEGCSDCAAEGLPVRLFEPSTTTDPTPTSRDRIAADALLWAAERIDPGPRASRAIPLDEQHDATMCADRGTATNLRFWAEQVLRGHTEPRPAGSEPHTLSEATQDDDQVLSAWCAAVARSHQTYESREWVAYPSPADRDRGLIEWAVRCLGNTGYSAAEHTARVVEILAERHNLLAEAAQF